jgi:hypothetical protein
MPYKWLAALIDPTSVLRDKSETNELVGAALLLDGQLAEYSRREAELGVPPLGGGTSKKASVDEQLLAATGAWLSGAQEPWLAHHEIFRRTDATIDQKASAAILGAVGLADADKSDEAVELLNEARSLTDDTLILAFVDVHLGLRMAEADTIENALRATRRALKETKAGRDHRLWRASIRVVAEYNEAAFNGLSGSYLFRRLPSRHLTLADVPLRHEAQALERYLDDEFESRLETGGTRIIGRTEDPVERDLFRAVLRSECLADWYELRDQRRRLGHYKILAAMAEEPQSLVPAFHLLRRARDAKGLKLATRSLRYRGPLEMLATIGNAFAALEWRDHDEEQIAAVLQGTVDMLEEKNAVAALTRIVRRVDLNRREYWIIVLAHLQRVLRSNQQLSVLRTFRSAVSSEPRAYAAQEIARAMSIINWASVPKPERDRWTVFLKANLASEGDRQLIAEALAGALAPVERELVTKEINRAMREKLRLNLAVTAINAEVSLERDVVSALKRANQEALERVRTDASGGKYSLGGISVGHLFASILITYGGEPNDWRALLDFIADAKVSDTEKAPALDYLAYRSEDLPTSARELLRVQLHELVAFHDPLFGSEARFEGSIVRLGVALGHLDEEQAFSRVVRLATEEGLVGRLEAAGSIGPAYRTFRSAGILTVGLMLSRDPAEEVRAEAGHALAAIAAPLEADFERLRVQRLRELLQEPGVLIPLRVLHGLRESDSERLILDPAIRQEVQGIVDRNPSAILREAASAVRHTSHP